MASLMSRKPGLVLSLRGTPTLSAYRKMQGWRGVWGCFQAAQGRGKREGRGQPAAAKKENGQGGASLGDPTPGL